METEKKVMEILWRLDQVFRKLEMDAITSLLNILDFLCLDTGVGLHVKTVTRAFSWLTDEKMQGKERKQAQESRQVFTYGPELTGTSFRRKGEIDAYLFL